LHQDLHEGNSIFRFRDIWKMKLPLKIKYFTPNYLLHLSN
jgi:hypothetical protein